MTVKGVAPSRRLRVVFITAHDSLGGAARACSRVFDALQTWCSDDIDLVMRTPNKTRQESQILGGKPQRSAWQKTAYFLRTRLKKFFPARPFVTDNALLHSQALYDTGMANEINKLKPDVVLLGWLGNSTISIKEIGELRAPIVWRLSDMWMPCGAEHYTARKRYEHGYSRRSRPTEETGPDINRRTFLRKLRHWSKPGVVIALSQWQAQVSRSSPLSADWPTFVVPVPIDSGLWFPENKAASRDSFGLGKRDMVILFGSGGGTRRSFKGAEILLDAVRNLRSNLGPDQQRRRISLVIFGEAERNLKIPGINVVFLGRLDDDALRRAYSSADVLVAPSTVEAFGQVAAEAQACGLPAVAFRQTGLEDVVIDGVTGKLAESMTAQSLSEAIGWVLSDDSRREQLSLFARAKACSRWNPREIAIQYSKILRTCAGF